MTEPDRKKFCNWTLVYVSLGCRELLKHPPERDPCRRPDPESLVEIPHR